MHVHKYGPVALLHLVKLRDERRRRWRVLRQSRQRGDGLLYSLASRNDVARHHCGRTPHSAAYQETAAIHAGGNLLRDQLVGVAKRIVAIRFIGFRFFVHVFLLILCWFSYPADPFPHRSLPDRMLKSRAAKLS